VSNFDTGGGIAARCCRGNAVDVSNRRPIINRLAATETSLAGSDTKFVLWSISKVAAVSAFDIRVIQPADEPAVLALWRTVFSDDPPTHDARAAIRLKTATQGDLFFVATVENRIAGTILAGFDGYRGWIYRVAVDPAFQRRGIGTALVKRAEQELIARGVPKVKLQIRAANQSVVSFYERLGYAVETCISMGKAAG
jgi:ribosomal protein S18 acetylase RimI-like enzyme